ncbi:Unknown protein sequence [Pseudomonas amygdali pv. sesami]|nr:Unknown protein sequence [Pseudomonas amygdali pv. sesami]
MIFYPVNGVFCTHKSILEFDIQVFARKKTPAQLAGATLQQGLT